MRPFKEVLERYDALWEEVEEFIRAYFERERAGGREGVVDLKELNTAVTTLKRAQDGRRAIHLDNLKLRAGGDHGGEVEDLDDKEVSRILQFLERGGGHETEEGDTAEAL
jgi:hypothetical protein